MELVDFTQLTKDVMDLVVVVVVARLLEFTLLQTVVTTQLTFVLKLQTGIMTELVDIILSTALFVLVNQ
jgi:hypothetical protein